MLLVPTVNACGGIAAATACTTDWTPLLKVLQAHGIGGERLTCELHNGAAYWAMERELCAAVAQGERIDREAVVRALRLKSFDYRVLSLVLFGVRCPFEACLCVGSREVEGTWNFGWLLLREREGGCTVQASLSCEREDCRCGGALISPAVGAN